MWEDENMAALSELVVELICTKSTVERYVREAQDFPELSSNLKSLIKGRIENASNELTLAISQCMMKDFADGSEDNLKIYAGWRECVVERGGLT